MRERNSETVTKNPRAGDTVDKSLKFKVNKAVPNSTDFETFQKFEGLETRNRSHAMTEPETKTATTTKQPQQQHELIQPHRAQNHSESESNVSARK
jgi:hypothetical protein